MQPGCVSDRVDFEPRDKAEAACDHRVKLCAWEKCGVALMLFSADDPFKMAAFQNPGHVLQALVQQLGMFARRGLALLLIFALACSGSQQDAKRYTALDPEAVRYRLLLRENPVDPGEAFRCYGSCQDAGSPDGYMECLQTCPGFEVSAGMRCLEHEVPPVAACFTARKVILKGEPNPGLVVLSVIAGVAVVVGLASVCAASAATQCGYGYGY